MAHEISKTDKVLSVRQPMWHGLEDLLQEAPSRDEAEKLVHDWTVYREPLYRRKVTIEDGNEYESFELYKDSELNVRSDTGKVLADVNSDRIDVNPSQVWDIAETIMKQDSSIKVETAGSLREGKDIWILLKLDQEIEVIGDGRGTSVAYFALQNSYTMGAALRFQPTMVRIQCANTSTLADLSAETAGLNLSLAHTQNLLERITEIEDKLAAWKTGIDAWKNMKEAMAMLPVSPTQTNWFIEHFMWMPELASDRVRENVEFDRVQLIGELFNDYNDGVRGTALGLFEAASSYQGHVRTAQSQMTRFKRSMLDPDTTLRDAANLALEAVTV